jgi:hypothetical protein
LRAIRAMRHASRGLKKELRHCGATWAKVKDQPEQFRRQFE